MSKKKNKTQKELRRLRKELCDLAETVDEMYKDMDAAFGKIDDLHSQWSHPVPSARVRVKSTPTGSVTASPGRFNIPAEEPEGYETAPAGGGVISWDEEAGLYRRIADVTPDRDPEASEYSFWFDEATLKRMGIPDMSYHLEEVPGQQGRLRIVEGPPTKLLPEHREIVENAMDGAE